MDWTLEVVVLPVSDIDRSIAFYRDKVGFNLDHDTRTDQMHVVQLTPRGSGCSIVFGDLPSQNQMEPGSMKGLQLVVEDAEAARQELLSRGVEVSEITKFGDQDERHLLRLLRPGRQHLGGAGAEGARHEAAHPGRGTRAVRGVGGHTDPAPSSSTQRLVAGAEEVGFEPTGPSRARRLSRSLPSTARPLLRRECTHRGRGRMAGRWRAVELLRRGW